MMALQLAIEYGRAGTSGVSVRRTRPAPSSTLIFAAPRLFGVIQWCGVAYLSWLGLRALRAAFERRDALEAPRPRAGAASLFRQSFLLQAANPKSVLFFCTLLPVFAGQAEGAPARIAVLGVAAILSEYPVLLGYSVLASRAARLFRGDRERRVLDGLSGAALLCAAGTVARASLRAR